MQHTNTMTQHNGRNHNTTYTTYHIATQRRPGELVPNVMTERPWNSGLDITSHNVKTARRAWHDLWWLQLRGKWDSNIFFSIFSMHMLSFFIIVVLFFFPLFQFYHYKYIYIYICFRSLETEVTVLCRRWIQPHTWDETVDDGISARHLEVS